MTTASHARARRRPIVRWVLLALAAVVVFCVAWILVRGLLARDALVSAVPIAQAIRADLNSGEVTEVGEQVSRLRAAASSAAALTSDPIWRAAEYAPILGPNLTAVRESAEVVDDVANGALPPLAELAETFSLDSIGFVDGRLDLAPLRAAAPLIAEVTDAMASAADRAALIETTDTVSQVGEAVDELVELVEETHETVASLDTALTLLLPMLGSDEPRTYLLLSLNNAELRSPGGIPGAVATLRLDDGDVSLVETSSAGALGRFAEPVLELSDGETNLFGSLPGRFMQNTTLTPNFARTGELAAEMWRLRTGEAVDGVISVDPVALSYVLSVIGPIQSSGVTLDGSNAVPYLLNGVYFALPTQARQDAFFGRVTGEVMSALTSREYGRRALIDAFVRAMDEGRINVWSSDPSEQELVATTPLAGAMPVGDATHSAFGVYLNDYTAAKMDFYLRMSATVAAAQCGVSSVPTFSVTVDLTSYAPADAGSNFPIFITGGGLYGTEPGRIATNVYVYAPPGTRILSVERDGREPGYDSGTHDGLTVAGVATDLAPGQTARVVVVFEAPRGTPMATTLDTTPMASPVDTRVDALLECPR